MCTWLLKTSEWILQQPFRSNFPSGTLANKTCTAWNLCALLHSSCTLALGVRLHAKLSNLNSGTRPVQKRVMSRSARYTQNTRASERERKSGKEGSNRKNHKSDWHVELCLIKDGTAKKNGRRIRGKWHKGEHRGRDFRTWISKPSFPSLSCLTVLSSLRGLKTAEEDGTIKREKKTNNANSKRRKMTLQDALSVLLQRLKVEVRIHVKIVCD